MKNDIQTRYSLFLDEIAKFAKDEGEIADFCVNVLAELNEMYFNYTDEQMLDRIKDRYMSHPAIKNRKTN